MSGDPPGTLPEVPSWAVPMVCADCGGAIFGSQGWYWSSGDPANHRHVDCELAAVYVDRVAVIDTLRYQALLDVGEALGRLVAGCDDEHWNSEVAAAVSDARLAVDEGLAAFHTARKSC